MYRTTSAAIAALAFVATLVISPLTAQAQSFPGDTTGGPTWNRPVEGAPPTPPTSGVGTAVPYETISFTVDVSGPYAFNSIAAAIPVDPWDNYAFLYQNSFNPTDQFTNVIVGNDDFPNIGTAGFSSINLTAGTTYIFVSTGFANDDFGPYLLEIGGPGTASVPEPTTLVAAAGLGLVALRRRRA